jgi:hypothetical protein
MIFLLIYVKLLPQRDLSNLQYKICLSVHIYKLYYYIQRQLYLQSDVVDDVCLRI